MIHELERRQRLTRTGRGNPPVHWVRFREAGVSGGRYVALCGQHIGVHESKQTWAAVSCAKCTKKHSELAA